MEIRLENVLHVVGIRGDGVPQHVNVDGAGWGFTQEMSVPVAEIGELFQPTHRQVALAKIAVTPGLHPGDEDEEGEEGEEKGEGEEEEAAGSRH